LPINTAYESTEFGETCPVRLLSGIYRKEIAMPGNTYALLIRALSAFMLLALVLTAQASPSNKWRLEFSGNAESSGIIELRISPVGGIPIEATIDIEDGTSENGVAKAVVKSLKVQLPEDGYHIERDDGEDVLLKKKGSAADFDIEIVSNTVKGVRINPDRE